MYGSKTFSNININANEGGLSILYNSANQIIYFPITSLTPTNVQANCYSSSGAFICLGDVSATNYFRFWFYYGRILTGVTLKVQWQAIGTWG